MEVAGTFNCERFDCPRDKGECSKCSKPVLGRDVAVVLSLWKRCRDWNVLPEAGGILDQRESTMELLDVVSNEVARWNAKRRSDEQAELEKQRMMGGLSGRR